jgi:hypothetical protein
MQKDKRPHHTIRISGPIAKYLDEYEKGALILMFLGASHALLDEYAAFCHKEKLLNQQNQPC